eukprot:Seg4611.2 transcript_id=Seg4611.2/GoldUCD/mRNA.D3Y31 product="putative ATP-dependent RNA helicase R290" protein_id=Seg4611.2/GoldUCD/D3Y31
MFHAGTPESVKQHVLTNVTSAEGHILILVCTIAFGMGVDCKNVTRIVHFGGSKSIESYLQECGRAGRNGAQSTCFLLYNGVLMKNSDPDMSNYVVSTICRRKEIGSIFQSIPDSQVKGCMCCDICARECMCGGPKCTLDFEVAFEQEEECKVLRARPVTQEQESELSFKLESYKQTLLPANISCCPQVSFATSFFEFGDVQIKQVLARDQKILLLPVLSCPLRSVCSTV